MEKPASGWFLHWSSTTRVEEHTWGIFREHVLQHFEVSNYQAVLREKLQRLKQTADIETYNGEYSALIFRVEGMSVLDQVLTYANGLKPRTRSYVKLENPETLGGAMDLAVKYEVTHFVEEARDRQHHRDKKKPWVDRVPNNKTANRTRENRSEKKIGSSLSRNPSVLKIDPVFTARNLVTSGPTVSSEKRSRRSRETGNRVGE
ncbi:unnamed protein product [Phytophthora fragariaefolia]|uniref:Unnamed protein product n=1 Tax=Phytophthora fragariaefolia TaxID=1490495 RepID=A0A9W6Y658_9STRA|nr:unnamed protein product [Phytophthora fragariaefolia]